MTAVSFAPATFIVGSLLLEERHAHRIWDEVADARTGTVSA